MNLKDYKVGITGNWYYISKERKDLEHICELIKKSKSAIYWNKKYQVFAIRIKSKAHKNYIVSEVFSSNCKTG